MLVRILSGTLGPNIFLNETHASKAFHHRVNFDARKREILVLQGVKCEEIQALDKGVTKVYFTQEWAHLPKNRWFPDLCVFSNNM